MKICIVVPTLTPHDAIGNDVRHQCKILSEKEETYIYAENYTEDAFKSYMLDKKELLNLIKEQNNIIIYHHGVYWEEGDYILNNANCRIFMKYHNITWPNFFEPYNDVYTLLCSQGRTQTADIVALNKVEKYLCDSNYNSYDILNLGVDKDKIKIVAPFHKLDDFQNVKPNVNTINNLMDEKINLLFVSRFAPNKGHKHLVEVIRYYVELYDKNIRLNIIGGIDEGLRTYVEEIHDLIDKYNVNDYINILNKITFEELHTYFNYSHFFLLLSEHEGFCLPILEAQLHDLPIIAFDTTAISETLGEEQLIFKSLDYKEIATSINLLYRNPQYKHYLIENGRKNLKRYDNPKIEKDFMKSIGLI